jgi:hypothetical protein
LEASQQEFVVELLLTRRTTATKTIKADSLEEAERVAENSYALKQQPDGPNDIIEIEVQSVEPKTTASDENKT